MFVITILIYFNTIAESFGCLYKVKSRSKSGMWRLNRQNGIMFESLELMKIFKNPEVWLETLPTASICLKPKKESNPQVVETLSPSLIKSGCLYTIYVCHWRNTCSIPGTFEHLVFYVGCKCLHNIPDEIGEKTWEFLAGMKQTMINKCRLAGYLTCHLFDAQLFVLE